MINNILINAKNVMIIEYYTQVLSIRKNFKKIGIPRSIGHGLLNNI